MQISYKDILSEIGDGTWPPLLPEELCDSVVWKGIMFLLALLVKNPQQSYHIIINVNVETVVQPIK